MEGTRLSCADIALGIEANDGIDFFLEIYDYLDASDLLAALDYCSDLKCLDDRPESYCSHCVLDARAAEEPKAFIESIDELKAWARSGETAPAFLGSKAEWEDEKKPKKVWKIAENLRREIHA